MQVGIIGASGYSGVELTRLVLGHPTFQLRFVTSDRWVGQSIASKTRLDSPLRYVSNDDGLQAAKDTSLVFLATPAETSLQLAPTLVAAGVKVVDLSGAFRLKDARKYPTHYRFEHQAPRLLEEAVYGLPELDRSKLGPSTRLVANPGCYATAAAVSVAPLLRAGLVDPSSIVISAASGVSGAGRKATEEYGFMEIDADFRAYRTLSHQHVPEIEQTLGVSKLVFTPHLLPMKRGILSTTVARLREPGADVQAALRAAYAHEPMFGLLPSADSVRIAEVAHTPWCLIGATCDETHVVVVTALDNLLKGAASQALQNANLLSGLSERSGLQPFPRA